MTKAEKLFRSSEAKRQDLHTILNNPVFLEAVQICSAISATPPSVQMGVPYDTTCAHVLQRGIGASRQIADLRRLTLPPEEAKAGGSPDREEYMDNVDADLVAALAEKNKSGK